MEDKPNNKMIPTRKMIKYLRPKQTPELLRIKNRMRLEWAYCLLAAAVVNISIWKIWPSSKLNNNFFT